MTSSCGALGVAEVLGAGPYPRYESIAPGHVNSVGLTDLGRQAVEEMMRLGMIVDIDHMSEKAANDTLALATARSYPLAAGHVAFRDIADDRNEYQRTAGQLAEIARLGGMVAVGLHQSDLRSPPGSPVANNAPGSSKSWAQAYWYAKQKMGGRGVGIGTDINGFAGVASPRFGLNACYELRKDGGEEPERAARRRLFVDGQGAGVAYDRPVVDYRAYRFEGALEGDVYDMEERDVWEAIAIFRSGTDPDAADMPGPLRRTIWQNGKIRNLARGFAAASPVPYPFIVLPGDNTYNEQRAAFFAKSGATPASENDEVRRMAGVIRRVWVRWAAMQGPNPPLRRNLAGRRDFDINIDGVAHYGLLPDFIQDLRNVGLAPGDLAPLFRSAEDYLRMWARCAAAAPTPFNAAFVSQTLPAVMQRGERADVTVTMRNTGESAWLAADGVRLGFAAPQGAGTWGVSRLDLPAEVAAGQDAAFRFTIASPPVAGMPQCRWRMVRGDDGWFGDLSPAHPIEVQETAECVQLRARIAELESEITGLQEDLQQAAPAQRGPISRQIKDLQKDQGDAETRADELGCGPG